jgi:hypothetical protein
VQDGHAQRQAQPGVYRQARFRPVSFTITPGALATLAWHGRVYASGVVLPNRLVLLHARRRLREGRYTLILAGRHSGSRHTITIR